MLFLAWVFVGEEEVCFIVSYNVPKVHNSECCLKMLSLVVLKFMISHEWLLMQWDALVKDCYFYGQKSS